MPAWSGLFNGVHGTNHTLINQPTNLQQRIAKLMKKVGARANARVGIALTGAVIGGAATENTSRARSEQASSALNLGGRRVIETVPIINRVTTSQDEAALDDIFNRSFAPNTYPVDRARNGGGGKTTGF